MFETFEYGIGIDGLRYDDALSLIAPLRSIIACLLPLDEDALQITSLTEFDMRQQQEFDRTSTENQPTGLTCFSDSRRLQVSLAPSAYASARPGPSRTASETDLAGIISSEYAFLLTVRRDLREFYMNRVIEIIDDSSLLNHVLRLLSSHGIPTDGIFIRLLSRYSRSPTPLPAVGGYHAPKKDKWRLIVSIIVPIATLIIICLITARMLYLRRKEKAARKLLSATLSSTRILTHDVVVVSNTSDAVTSGQTNPRMGANTRRGLAPMGTSMSNLFADSRTPQMRLHVIFAPTATNVPVVDVPGSLATVVPASASSNKILSTIKSFRRKT